MYLTHYNLREKPFSISPDPKFLWLGEKHQEALAIMKYGILEDKGFLLLTGAVGTGKTALINALVHIIESAALVAAVPDPGLNSLDFFNYLSEEFEMKRTFDTKGDFLIYFKQFLHEAYRDQRKVLLIIDEAQRLNHELLEQIRLLSNIEIDDRKLINIFFVGQTEFNYILRQERNKAVRQRISVSYHLEPLTESEIEKYIHHRLKIAGTVNEIFSANAIGEIFSNSKGNPRLTNILCDHALLTGYSAGLTTIDKKIISECSNELQMTGDLFSHIDKNQQKKQAWSESDATGGSQKPIMAVSLMLILFLSIGGYFLYTYQSKDAPQWAIEDIAAKKELKYSEAEKKALLAQTSVGITEKQQIPDAEVGTENTDAANMDESTAKENSMVLSGDDESPRNDATHSTSVPIEPHQKMILHFEHNSNEIPDEAFELLNQIVRYASSNPQVGILVEGYTDSFGNYWYNKKLSKFRADIVKNYFAGQGIPLYRIRSLGRGSENPIAGNNTFEGRKKNRRVEIKIEMRK